MKILLDTHVWIWRLLEPERLSERAATVLADSSSELYLSPISIWETLILACKGRIELEPSPAAWVSTALYKSTTHLAPFNYDVALRSEDLPGFESRDPADRFLMGSALVHSLVVATADRAMQRWDRVETVW